MRNQNFCVIKDVLDTNGFKTETILYLMLNPCTNKRKKSAVLEILESNLTKNYFTRQGATSWYHI